MPVVVQYFDRMSFDEHDCSFRGYLVSSRVRVIEDLVEFTSGESLVIQRGMGEDRVIGCWHGKLKRTDTSILKDVLNVAINWISSD